MPRPNLAGRRGLLSAAERADSLSWRAPGHFLACLAPHPRTHRRGGSGQSRGVQAAGRPCAVRAGLLGHAAARPRKPPSCPKIGVVEIQAESVSKAGPRHAHGSCLVAVIRPHRNRVYSWCARSPTDHVESHGPCNTMCHGIVPTTWTGCRSNERGNTVRTEQHRLHRTVIRGFGVRVPGGAPPLSRPYSHRPLPISSLGGGCVSRRSTPSAASPGYSAMWTETVADPTCSASWPAWRTWRRPRRRYARGYPGHRRVGRAPARVRRSDPEAARPVR
jgi:hypothetical protein